jgi:hypothetical protein
MACGSCAERARKRRLAEIVEQQKTDAPARVYASSNVVKNTPAKVVEASKTQEKVLLRYYGGGSGTARVRGCRSCGGGKVKYATVTSERIMFASEDAPNGFFNLLVSVGHDYPVTRSQADYMLTLTYKNRAGQVVHKFKEV